MYSILIRIPILRDLINRRKFNSVANKLVAGEGLRVSRAAVVYLRDGSQPTDIHLGKNVCIEGTLGSQNHGKITIGDYSRLGGRAHIQCVDSVTIGENTGIAINTYICDHNTHPINPEFRHYMQMQPANDDAGTWKYSDHAPVVIGNNCWIGQNVRIQKGVTIGDNSIIAANSVVTKSVPANCIAAGNPARVVKTDIDKIPAPTTCEGFNEWKKKQNNQ